MIPNIDFDKLAELARTDLRAFENERTRIIESYIKSLPENRRKIAYAFQLQLDLKRYSLSSADFIAYCVAKIGENAEQLQALIQTLDITVTETLVAGDNPQQLPANVIPFPQHDVKPGKN